MTLAQGFTRGREGALDDPARLHWRHQLLLTFAFVGVGITALALLRLSVSREAHVETIRLIDGRTVRSASYLVTLWPAALGVFALSALALVLLVHAYRVAAFTFRRGDQ